MLYPYRCTTCGPFEILKPMARAARPEPCPGCGTPIAEQDFGAKRVGGYVSTDGNWSGGKLVPQLAVNHPDRMVTSKTQMEHVYKKHGICLDTGDFVSKDAQLAATVPRKKRTGKAPGVVSGVRKDT
tara:strand:+ start:5035 stop:5415 length:381 start_codon:yes stop_codon:yes gene_type:complete